VFLHGVATEIFRGLRKNLARKISLPGCATLCHPATPAARRIATKIKTVIIALAATAFADHNRTDEQGRKRGHWTEFPESRDI